MTLGEDTSVSPSDLIGLSRFLTNTTDNTSAFSATEIKALLNQSQQDLQIFIINSAMTHWKGEADIKKTDIKSGQSEYNFPDDILTIDKMEVSYDGSDWYEAIYKNIEQFEGSLYNREAGEGIHGSTDEPVYFIYDYSIWLDPVPDQDVTDGIRLWFSEKITDLSSSTDEPVFAGCSHDVLAYMASSKWCSKNEEWNKKKSLDEEINKMKKELKSFYQIRILDKKPKITRKQRIYE